MRNERIRKAYDSINPSPADKRRILNEILSERNPESAVRETAEKTVYTARKPVKPKYGNLFTTLAAAIMLIIIAGAGVSFLRNNMDMNSEAVDPTAEWIVTEKTAIDHYMPVLEKYREAMDGDWTADQCEIEGISLRMQAGYDVTETGYALLDLDGDGREELIIAEESAAQNDNIWDLYTTLEDGTPIQLWVDACDGEQCILYENNIISISSSYKHEMDITFYHLESGRLMMHEMFLWEDEDTVFHTDAQGNTRQITSREGQSIGNSYTGVKLELTSLADAADDLPDNDASERYAPVLEKYRTALTEHWDKEQCFEQDISTIAASSPDVHNNLGWCLMDIDGNGTQELIISYGKNGVLVDLYCLQPEGIRENEIVKIHGSLAHALTIENGVCHLAKTEGRIQYSLCEDGTVACQIIYEGGHGHSTCYYKVKPWGMELQGVLMYRNENDGYNAYSYGPDENDQTNISMEEVGEIIMAHQPMQFEVKPIVDWDAYESAEPVEMDAYDALIYTYRKAVLEDWDSERCINNGLSEMIGSDKNVTNTLGYALLDVDGNGTEELIISDGDRIYDLYTRKADMIEHVLMSSESNTFMLCKDGILREQVTFPKGCSWYFYQLSDESQKLLHILTYQDEADGTSDVSQYYYGTNEDNGTPISKEEAGESLFRYPALELTMTPFE